MYNKNDIILIPFPYSDLTGSKRRPALIISNEKMNNTDDRICLLITSNKPDKGMLIKDDSIARGSLPLKSWVKPSRIFTVDKRIIKKKICTISEEFHDKIIEELGTYIG